MDTSGSEPDGTLIFSDGLGEPQNTNTDLR